MIETQRLILRPWCLEDAEALYEVAKDPRIRSQAGWPAHTSVDNSREVIEAVFMNDTTYAICKQDSDRVIGCVGLMIGECSNFKLPSNEGELGYWMGVPYWGHGYATEACRALVDWGFSELDLEKIWAGAFEDNTASQRVQEKCGLTLHHINEQSLWADNAEDQAKKEVIRCLTRAEWQKQQ